MTENPRFRTISSPLTPEQAVDRQEKLRRQEIRSNFLVPVHVMWTSDVPEDAARYAEAGVLDALIASGQAREPVILGSNRYGEGEYSSADWYEAEGFRRQVLSRDVHFGPQLDTGQFGKLFTEEPWQEKPHWEVLVVNSDLNARVNGEFINFVFGSTNTEFPYSVQSVRRILDESVADRELKLAMIRNLLRHEVGHMLGLVERTRGMDGLNDNHCPNPCSMKQTLSTKELAQNTVKVENRRKYFCNECLDELQVSKDRFESLPNISE